MPSEPHLRAVSEPGAGDPPPQARRAAARGGAWVPIALGIALACALLLLLWSRSQMGGRIAVLEDEVRALEAAVEERDRVIEAHRQRLGTVKLRVDELRSLLESPLPARE